MKPAVLVILAILLVGCNSDDAADLKRDAGNLASTAGRAAGNAQLVARINAALLQRKGVDVSGLHIEAKDGSVMVGGHVRDATEKKTVLETVKEIRGVERVEDQLRIESK
jgi:osmotically-inducible protein OsmY